MKKKIIGTIHDPKTLFLRLTVGTATSSADVKLKYEMSINMADNRPIVLSEKTGKWFTLSWTDIITLAVEAGIDKE